jgi:hypothetical protein
MAHKKKRGHPVPPDNQPPAGPPGDQGGIPQTDHQSDNEGGDQEQDPKRRLGNFTGAGEHSIQQPGGTNDANH